jgi:hypothetical protein
LWISAELFVIVPVAGHVKLSAMKGSLSDGAAVQAIIDVVLALGTANFTVKKDDSDSKNYLYCNASVHITLIGNTSIDNTKILKLP